MISINRLKEMALEDIENNPEKHLEEYTELLQQLDQLKAENGKLKNNITSFDYLNSLTDEQVAVLYTASIDELAIRGYKAKYNTEVSLLTRYQQALTEIKEIAEKRNYLDYNECLDDILQKISECEGNDEKRI